MSECIVLVIAPARDPEKCLLKAAGWNEGENWSSVAVNTKGAPTKNGELPNDCIFILINQCQDECKIQKLLGSVKSFKKKVIVWTHQNEENGYAPFDGEAIKVILEVACQDFSHTPSTRAKLVLDFMESFSTSKNNEWINRKGILEKFLNETIKNNATSAAHTLRADILTPFIPFHLYHQLDNKDSVFNEWKGIFKECCNVINAEDIIKGKFNTLICLKKDLPPGIKLPAYLAFESLKDTFQKSENDCRKTIEDFAQCLEKIVNYIESGEEASAKNK